MLETLAIIYVTTSMLVSIVLLRSPHFDRVQKLSQAAMAWVLPIVGAVAMLVFHSVVYRNMRTRAQPARRNHNKDEIMIAPSDFD